MNVPKTVLILLGLLLLVVVASRGCGTSSTTSPSTQSTPPATGPRTDLPQLEANFKTLMAAGVVVKIDGSHGEPWVMVGRGFYALTYEQKESAAKMISDYWAAVKGGAPGSAVAYELHDAYSGKKLYTWNGYKLTQ